MMPLTMFRNMSFVLWAGLHGNALMLAQYLQLALGTIPLRSEFGCCRGVAPWPYRSRGRPPTESVSGRS